MREGAVDADGRPIPPKMETVDRALALKVHKRVNKGQARPLVTTPVVVAKSRTVSKRKPSMRFKRQLPQSSSSAELDAAQRRASGGQWVGEPASRSPRHAASPASAGGASLGISLDGVGMGQRRPSEGGVSGGNEDDGDSTFVTTPRRGSGRGSGRGRGGYDASDRAMMGALSGDLGEDDPEDLLLEAAIFGDDPRAMGSDPSQVFLSPYHGGRPGSAPTGAGGGMSAARAMRAGAGRPHSSAGDSRANLIGSASTSGLGRKPVVDESDAELSMLSHICSPRAPGPIDAEAARLEAASPDASLAPRSPGSGGKKKKSAPPPKRPKSPPPKKGGKAKKGGKKGGKKKAKKAAVVVTPAVPEPPSPRALRPQSMKRKEAEAEIDAITAAFRRKNLELPCTRKVFERAMFIPENEPAEMAVTRLPIPGGNLPINPFLHLKLKLLGGGKKKGKKKGGKKKGKKKKR
jgi:hypothetical protein